MTCNACGEHYKKHCGCKDCTRAVLELTHPEKIVTLRKVVIPASMGDDTEFPPKIGKYCNVILYYEANKHVYLYSSDGIPTLLEMDVPKELLDRVTALEDKDVVLQDEIENEASERLETDIALREDIDSVAEDLEEFKNSPDVVDIVATYADLQAYDTSSLGDKDVIRVLADETHDNESSYYRWNIATQTWTFIGATGPYYTKSETDSKIEVNRGLAHILTSEDYNWNSTSSSATEPYDSIALWLLPSGQYHIDDNSMKVFTSAVATKLSFPDQHMYLINKEPTANSSILVTPYSAAATSTKITFYVTAVANGQPSGGTTVNGMTIPWGDIPTVVQTTGSSTTNVMSQKAVSDAINNIPEYVVNLTADDYDFPDSSPNSVALWRLPDGIYYAPSPVEAVRDTYSTMISSAFFIVSHDAIDGAASILTVLYNSVEYSYAAANGNPSINPSRLINSSNVFNGLNAVAAGMVLDARQGKVLKDMIDNLPSAPTVVQTTGQSTTDVMSQDATTRMIYNGGDSKKVQIGANSGAIHNWDVAILGTANHEHAIAIGSGAAAEANGGIALGVGARVSTQGVFDVGLSGVGTSLQSANGYNGSEYRLLSGLYDPQNAHDAATKGYVDPATGSGAPTTSTSGNIGKIYIDTSTDTAYMCVKISGSTYTWKQITN